MANKSANLDDEKPVKKLKKHYQDSISEQVYTEQMDFASTSPEEDSPGDSEKDAGSEFLMGLNFMPNERNEYQGTGMHNEDKFFSERKLQVAAEDAQSPDISENTKVIASEQPDPWLDMDAETDTH